MLDVRRLRVLLAACRTAGFELAARNGRKKTR
jgi:hypothetical protein